MKTHHSDAESKSIKETRLKVWVDSNLEFRELIFAARIAQLAVVPERTARPR